MSLPKKTAIHRFPCIDQYPDAGANKGFITASQMQQVTQKALKKQGLKGKLSAAKTFKKLRAAFKVAALWNPSQYPQLNIAFLDGEPRQKEWVEKVITEKLQPHTSRIRFVWNASPEESPIRISFALKGQAWSTVGTDALKVRNSYEPTMNLGWLDDDVQYDAQAYKGTGQVVLHEFGHAMGMVHEHQNPKANPIVWNKEVVSRTLAATNGWDQATIDHNMFKKYGDAEMCAQATTPQDKEDYCQGEIVNGSKYDINSIMHYFYPADWILEGPVEIPVNTELSTLDKKWLRKYYGEPFEADTREIDEDEALLEEVEQDDEEKEKGDKIDNAIDDIELILLNNNIPDDDILEILDLVEFIADQGKPELGTYQKSGIEGIFSTTGIIFLMLLIVILVLVFRSS